MSTRLLIDANLSWRLANLLKDDFPEITHITNAGLSQDATDSSIWEFARQHQYNLVTSDEDFHLLALSKGFPPRIILLRTGNQSTKYIAGLLIKHKSEIIEFVTQEEYAVLEIY